VRHPKDPDATPLERRGGERREGKERVEERKEERRQGMGP
jgi:hypothetical protein